MSRAKKSRISIARTGLRQRDQSPLWESPLGQQVHRLERHVLAPLIRRFHGDIALWIGAHAPSASLLSGCMIRHPVNVLPTPSCPAGRAARRLADAEPLDVSDEPMPSVIAQIDQLPFKSGSIDAIVLHHALEGARDPRVGLREVARVLAPGGRLVIAGFNPMSLIGLRRLYARVFADVLSRHKCVNPLRLFDWLTVLGLELEQAPQYHAAGMPLFDIDLDTVQGSVRVQEQEQQREQGKREEEKERPNSSGSVMLDAVSEPGCASRLPFGGVIVLSAIKQTVSGRLPRVTLPTRRRMAPVAYPSVASWQRSDR